jgi:hypothetical protein
MGRFVKVDGCVSFVSLFDREPFLHPDRGLRIATRAAAVQAGRRPPPKAARSGLDGGEHGATLDCSGRRTINPDDPRRSPLFDAVTASDTCIR